ncbi:unnamed protein product [marine sediment metagenome]|uniref:Uncharacterized protein n=1 Tax=marine sediment metagenome TaxID=412755 RepID=X1AL61_9ZZZZ
MDAKQKVMSLLGTAVLDMKTSAKVVAYTVPAGKTAMIMAYVIHSPTASLAGGTDYDLGSGANADTWLQAVNLAAMTATDDYIVITDTTKYTIEAAAAEIGLKPITGSTLAANATVEIWGREI